MDLSNLQKRINDLVPGSVSAASAENGLKVLRLKREKMKPALSALKNDMGYHLLEDIFGRDDGGEFAVTYQLVSLGSAQRVFLTVTVAKHMAAIESIADMWPGAAYPEMELRELFGIEVEGLPPGRFLLPEDWAGFPLRKDYVFPDSYQGIEHSRPPLRKEHHRP